MAGVCRQAYNVAHSGALDLAVAPIKHNALQSCHFNKFDGEGYFSSTPRYMNLRITNTDSREDSSPCAFGIGKPADSLRVSYAAGAVLCTQTNEELVNIIACEMCHSLAYHEAERKSWRLRLNTVLIGGLAAGSSIGVHRCSGQQGDCGPLVAPEAAVRSRCYGSSNQHGSRMQR